MRRRLDGVHLAGPGLDAPWPDLPILLVANHVSWWDGFLLREVQRRLRPDAPLHVIMLEEELRRVPVFRWMGAVPLSASPMGARMLLRRLRHHLEERPNAVIGYFPQGRIWPSHRRPLGFERGGGWLASHLAPIAVVPVGLHLEPLTRPAPAAFISVGAPMMVGEDFLVNGAAPALETRVTAAVDAILACTRRHGEASPRRWTGGCARGGERHGAIS